MQCEWEIDINHVLAHPGLSLHCPWRLQFQYAWMPTPSLTISAILGKWLLSLCSAWTASGCRASFFLPDLPHDHSRSKHGSQVLWDISSLHKFKSIGRQHLPTASAGRIMGQKCYDKSTWCFRSWGHKRSLVEVQGFLCNENSRAEASPIQYSSRPYMDAAPRQGNISHSLGESSWSFTWGIEFQQDLFLICYWSRWICSQKSLMFKL